MASLEEERLIQMVYDFIESEVPHETPSISTSSAAISFRQEYTYLNLQGILGSATETEIEIFRKALRYVSEMGDERKRGSVKKRLMMRLRMDGYDASLCRSSWVATPDCPGGDYEYVVIVIPEGNGSSTRLIVDTDFRSQFEVARATPAYTQLSNTLPSIFVGSEEKLKRIISILCSAAQKSLKESGLHVPPWRKSNYMQSKWLPCFHKASTISLTFPIQNVWTQKALHP